MEHSFLSILWGEMKIRHTYVADLCGNFDIDISTNNRMEKGDKLYYLQFHFILIQCYTFRYNITDKILPHIVYPINHVCLCIMCGV